MTTSTVTKCFLDTNVLVYRFDPSEAAKQDRATRVLARTDVRFVVSTQVMLELYAVLTRKLSPPMPSKDAALAVAELARLEVAPADARLVMRAVDTSARHQLSIWDAMIIEAAAESGCDELWTEDLTDGAEVRGVRVVNPFAS